MPTNAPMSGRSRLGRLTPRPRGRVSAAADGRFGAGSSTPIRVDVQDQRADPVALPVAPQRLAELLVDTLIDAGVPGPAQADLTMVDPDTIASLNVEHLGGDGPTDVLSFPLDPFPDDAWPVAPPDPAGAVPPRMVGDVVLCPGVAQAQAAEAGHTPAEELLLLTTHGILHLLGFDHAEPAEEKEMFELQRQLLLTFLATRGRRGR